MNLTLAIFGGQRGLFVAVLSYLYLYIPLLTMGLMSRELGSGSIKLLYSSPITNAQIILGKYCAMLVYGLILVGVLLVYGAARRHASPLRPAFGERAEARRCAWHRG